MRVAIQRAMLIGAALLCAGAGSALFASSASAEGGLATNGSAWGQPFNLTPYTFTLVELHAGGGDGHWISPYIPPSSVAPGGTFVWALNPVVTDTHIGSLWIHDGWFTYRADVLGGAPEYLTLVISGCATTAFSDNGCGETPALAGKVYNTVAPPPPSWDPLDQPGPPPVAATSNPQIGGTLSDPISSDVTFQVHGDFTFDASGDPHSAALADVLNGLCDNAAGTACSFAPTGCAGLVDCVGGVTWGIGTAHLYVQKTNCGTLTNSLNLDQDVSTTASLTVGGGVTASAEASLFGVVSSELSLKVEAEHEWTQTNSFKKEATLEVPPKHVGMIYVAPEVGKVVGTLKLSTGVATYTIYHFGETRDGVSKDDQTPAFDAITVDRAATPAELQAASCGHTLRTGPPGAPKRKPRPPAAARRVRPTAASLFPGRGVARVKLGEAQAQVAGRLGRPLFTTTTDDDCFVLDPRCGAAAGPLGVWAYGRIDVVFGANRRVSAVLYSGPRRSAAGVGLGTRLGAFRAAYPRASCTRYAEQTDCRLAGRNHGRRVATVFHFSPHRGGWICDRVMIYFIARPARGRVRAHDSGTGGRR